MAIETSDQENSAGWASSFPVFGSTPLKIIRASLESFIARNGFLQERAWDQSIPALQNEASEVLRSEPDASAYAAILEYRLPLDGRRVDAVFLVSGSVLVLEIKGKRTPTVADLDQAAAYARDLRAYHRECQDRVLHTVVVPMLSDSEPDQVDGTWVVGPRHLDALVLRLDSESQAPPPSVAAFLDVAAYRPLPTLVQAAREIFNSRQIREVWRARAATDPAIECITSIAHEAARTSTRHLVLVTGVPGSGKALVGMRTVHAQYLDDLAIERPGGRPTVPALFLSGNGPLVQVLQYVLKGAGGGGKTFVRHIKDYLDSYVPRPHEIPPENLLVFDEAQRAFSPDRVRQIHGNWSEEIIRSEPAHFVEICERMPEWSVLIGLIGTGQEIHLGEEGGLRQWREALESSREPSRWTVHAPARVEEVFTGSTLRTRWHLELNLDTELRFHFAAELDGFVNGLLSVDVTPRDSLPLVRERPTVAAELSVGGFRLWATRDLEAAKKYLRDRYTGQPEARFGILASSRDRDLVGFGIDNSWQTTRRVKLGPWYSENEGGVHSCRKLESCVTEFGAQGLELDMVLLAWGSDFLRVGGKWSIERARKYKRGDVRVVDPFQLRVNAYRVLLTRGRDGSVVFIPEGKDFDETWGYLLSNGFRRLPT